MLNKLLLVIFICSCSSVKKITDSVRDVDYKSFLDKRVRPKNYLNMVWAKNLDPSHSSGNRPIGFTSPTIFEDNLFVGTLSGQIQAYNSENGSLLWTKDEGQPIGAKVAVFKDNIIYGSMFGRLFSRNTLTQELNYSIDLGSPIESEPLINDGKVYLHLRSHKIVALDALTGKIFWSYQRSIPFNITLQRVSKPMSYKGSIIVGFADGYLVSLTKTEGVLNWETQLSKAAKFIDVDVSPVIFNDSVVAGSAAGNLSFINPANGFITKTINIVAGHSPIVINQEMYVGSVFGEVYKLDKNAEIKKQKKVSGFAIGSMILWQGKIAVSTMGEDLLVLDPYEFDNIQSWKLGTEVSSTFGTIVTNSEVLSLYSSRNRLYTFKYY